TLFGGGQHVFAELLADADGVPHHPAQQRDGNQPRGGLDQVPGAAELQKVPHVSSPLFSACRRISRRSPGGIRRPIGGSETRNSRRSPPAWPAGQASRTSSRSAA